MRTVIRVLFVAVFLFILHAAQPAAAFNGCGEYECTIPIGFGSGSYCINEGAYDCICNEFGCMCGDCTCDDEGDCVIVPSQG